MLQANSCCMPVVAEPTPKTADIAHSSPGQSTVNHIRPRRGQPEKGRLEIMEATIDFKVSTDRGIDRELKMKIRIFKISSWILRQVEKRRARNE